MWRPFQYCKARLGLDWDPLSSTIHAFASTYIVLIYTKILAVSFNLVAPTRVYNESGELPYKVMSYEASIHFLSGQHLPYFILALCMLTVFCGVPFLFLLLYPTTCFQKFLNKTASTYVKLALHMFTDSFMGCYRDKTSGLECRYFAALYFLFRVVFLACIFFVQYSYMWLAAILVSLFISSLFAIVQPYKEKWLNVVDSSAFALSVTLMLLLAYKIHIAVIPFPLIGCFFLLPLLYCVGYFLYKVTTKVWRWYCAKHRGCSNDGRGHQKEREGGEEERNEHTCLIEPC